MRPEGMCSGNLRCPVTLMRRPENFNEAGANMLRKSPSSPGIPARGSVVLFARAYPILVRIVKIFRIEYMDHSTFSIFSRNLHAASGSGDLHVT